jgi:hypothetical protein
VGEDEQDRDAAKAVQRREVLGQRSRARLAPDRRIHRAKRIQDLTRSCTGIFGVQDHVRRDPGVWRRGHAGINHPASVSRHRAISSMFAARA